MPIYAVDSLLGYNKDEDIPHFCPHWSLFCCHWNFLQGHLNTCKNIFEVIFALFKGKIMKKRLR